MPQNLLEQYIKTCRQSLLENRETLEKFRILYNIKDKREFIEKLKTLEICLSRPLSHEDVPEEYKNELEKAGVFDRRNEGMLFMPLREINGRVVNMLYLSLNGRSPKLTGKGGLVNLKAFNSFESINAVDTITDFIYHYFHIKENVLPIIQSEVMPENFSAGIMNSRSVKEVTLLFNSPRWDHVRPILNDTDVRIYNIALPGNIRIREFLRDRSPNRIKAYMTAEKGKILKEEKEKREELKDRFKVIEESGELVFKTEDREYQIRGFSRYNFEKRVQVTLRIDDNIFPDKVDLSGNVSRHRFATNASNEYDISLDAVKQDLLYIYNTIDNLQSESYGEREATGKKEVHIYTPKDIHKVIKLITSRDPIYEVLIPDMAKLGIVGEEINIILSYLSSISRFPGDPLSVLVYGPPGTGKTTVVNTVLDQVPPEDLMKYSRITQESLYYMEEDDLLGKVLYIEETAGMKRSFESIRVVMTSGELSVIVTETDPKTGRLKSFERRLKVTFPIISTGVQYLEDEETASRFVPTHSDYSGKQQGRILESLVMRHTLTGLSSERYRKVIVKRGRDIQKSFKADLRIAIPDHLIKKMLINPGLKVAARKQEQFNNIVCLHAFIHQHSREKHKAEDDFGVYWYINVNDEDIDFGKKICTEIFFTVRGDLSRSYLDAAIKIRALILEKVKESRMSILEMDVSKSELMKRYNWPETTARRYLDELVRHEYLIRIKRSRERQHSYRLLFDDEEEYTSVNIFSDMRNSSTK